MNRIAYLLLGAALSLEAIDVMPCEWTPPCEEREWKMFNSFGIGYRRDRQRLLEPTYTAYLDNFNSATMQYQMVFSWDRLILKLTADYGWLINGDLSFKGFLPPFQSPQQNFGSFSIASGYTVDVLPSIGSRIPFWRFACQRGCLSFIPALGLNYNHFNVFPMGRKKSPSSGSSSFTTLEFTRPIQQDWWGPAMEGRIAFSWEEEWRFDIFYQYIHLNFRQTFSQAVSNYYPGAIDTSSIRYSTKGNTLRTQLGGADLSYRSPNNWQLGTHFEGSATWSNTSNTIVRTVRNFFLPALTETRSASTEKLSVHWTRYLVNFYGSYWF